MLKRRFIFSLIYFVILTYAMIVYNAPIYFIGIPLIPFVFYITTIFKIYIPLLLECIILIFILMSVVFGSVLNFYIIIPYWDIILHTISGFLLCLVPLYCIVYFKIEIPFFIKILFIFFVSLGFASLWELFEFSVDNIFNIDSQKNELEGVVDTMIDITVHTIGSIIFLIIYFIDNKFNSRIYNMISKAMFYNE